MLEALSNLYDKKLLWLLAIGEEEYFNLSRDERKDIQTMIVFIKRHLTINNLTVFDLAEHLRVNKEQFFDMTEIILADVFVKEVEDLC